MKFLNKIYSKIDKVVKYIFEYNKQIVELSYIDNGTGKDIICVPTHTMCNLGCKFCHTTDYIGKIPIVKITFHEIFYGINYIINDLKLNNNTLLISYMGCGEPFNCTKLYIIDGMDLVRLNYSYEKFKNVRFGIATCLPKDNIVNFFIFCNSVKERNFSAKLHLSLHFTEDSIRKKWMPNSLDIKSSIAACNFYKEYTGNDVEIHYTLIDNVNDTEADIERLNKLLWNTDFNIKFIAYNEKDSLSHKKSNKVELFANSMHSESEIYTPPGRDISSSCGMLSLEENYKKYIKGKV